jgi:putative SOS response-associated peptidase YedK
MCGRFTLTADPAALHAEFGVEPPADLQPRYNIAPTQPVLGIVAGNTGWKAGMLEWGLIPFWSRDRGGASQRINARSETLLQKPTFRDSFVQRRCLIIADGFFEWVKDGKRKQPVLIKREDGRPFAFAGLWDRWFEEPGKPVYTCTIVTTSASPLLRPVHDRMPVILDPRERDVWLSRTSSIAELQALLRPNETPFEVIPVTPLVNSAKNDGPEVITPL